MPKALSFGTALFLVILALAAKTLILQGVDQASQGVLGGSVAIAAIQQLDEQASLDVGSQVPDPQISSELSTGSLDGAQILPEIKDSPQVGIGSASLTEKNQEVIAKVAKETITAPAPKPKPAKPANYFIQPTSGRNWGARHGNNAVDIANSCGTSVKAAAAGTIVRDSNLGSGASGWNGGYGPFVLIAHANGTKTRYAHLSKVTVAVGQKVSQGQQIGTIGNKGNVKGATGCHLHFEVLGGTNPFARR